MKNKKIEATVFYLKNYVNDIDCVQNIYFNEEETMELVREAAKYNISFNALNPQSTENAINEWEYYLNIAAESGVDWEKSEYDLLGLKQAIEDGERAAYNESRDLISNWYTSRGC